MRGAQPSAFSRPMSSSLRGVAVGFAWGSQTIEPVKPTISQISAASSKIVRSLAGADVDRCFVRIMFQQVDAGIGAIVDMEEFRGAGCRCPKW